MTSKPALTNKSAQKALHYMLSQPDLMVKSWRARIYFYSSATFLKSAGSALIEYVNENEHTYLLRASCLQKLKDEDEMYALIGDTIIGFMRLKSLPFPHAVMSKRHLWEVDAWKRAMIFVFLLRVVLKLKTPKQWKLYNVLDYKFNIRAFRAYLRLDRTIIERSSLYSNLPDDMDLSPLRRKRKLEETSPSGASEAAATTFCVLSESDDE